MGRFAVLNPLERLGVEQSFYRLFGERIRSASLLVQLIETSPRPVAHHDFRGGHEDCEDIAGGARKRIERLRVALADLGFINSIHTTPGGYFIPRERADLLVAFATMKAGGLI